MKAAREFGEATRVRNACRPASVAHQTPERFSGARGSADRVRAAAWRRGDAGPRRSPFAEARPWRQTRGTWRCTAHDAAPASPTVGHARDPPAAARCVRARSPTVRGQFPLIQKRHRRRRLVAGRFPPLLGESKKLLVRPRINRHACGVSPQQVASPVGVIEGKEMLRCQLQHAGIFRVLGEQRFQGCCARFATSPVAATSQASPQRCCHRVPTARPARRPTP